MPGRVAAGGGFVLAAMIAVLSGGVGGARFLRGLSQVIDPGQIVSIVNTGDDIDLFDLHVSPDLDIVTYTLAGLVDEQKGWGFAGDSFHCLEFLSRLGEETWFLLGDRDLATHLHRTRLLRSGLALSEVTAGIAQKFGLRVRLLPMTDESVSTWIDTTEGKFHFEEYLVRRGVRDPVLAVDFHGSQSAKPAPGVLETLQSAEAILIAPSNPVVSIGPILSVPGVRDAVATRKESVAAVSPIVAGSAIKGPAIEIMQGIGVEASAKGVARLYQDLLGVFVMDHRDKSLVPGVEKLGLRTVVTETVMRDTRDWGGLARVTLDAALGRGG